MNKYFLIVLLTFNILPKLYTQSIMTADKVVSLMNNRYENLKGFSARFVERNGNRVLYGEMLYKKPNKFKITYSREDQSIYCNGETLWIFLPKIRVVSEQKLEGSSSPLYTKSGVARLLSQYNIDFYGDRKLSKISSFKGDELNISGYDSSSYTANDDRQAYHMLLTPKQASVDKTGFVRIHLWIDSQGTMLRILGISTTKSVVEYLFTSISVGDVYSDEIFEADIPQSMQVLKNALVPK